MSQYGARDRVGGLEDGELCVELWTECLSLPPIHMTESLTPSVAVFADRSSQEVITLNEVIRVEF